MSIFNHEDMTDREADMYQRYELLKSTIEEYLKYGSCDGKIERRQLRKDLADLIGAEYDDRNQSIKRNQNDIQRL